MKKVVIIGGGFTGSFCARSLENKFNVILIDDKTYFEFTPGVLRSIVDPKHENKIQSKHKNYLKKTEVVYDNITEISKDNVKTKSGKSFDFDYLIIASGSRYEAPIKEHNLIGVARAKELIMYHDKVQKAKNISIVGGGLVGVELAAEICTVYKNKKITIVHSKSELIDRNHSKARKYAKRFLERRGVKILFGEYAHKTKDKEIITRNGKSLESDVSFLCTGVKPNYEFIKGKLSSILDERNYVKVNEFLQVEGYKNILSGGDIANIKEEKTAQAAEKQARVIVKNIVNLEKKNKLEKYSPKKKPMLISLGKYDGILDNGNFAIVGFIPAFLKFFVEWKGMRKRK